jgi:hypothetical protein
LMLPVTRLPPIRIASTRFCRAKSSAGLIPK